MDANLNFVAKAQRDAEALGHDIAWDEVGDNVAHGHCRACGMTIAAASPDGLSTTTGEALERPCPEG